MKSRKQKTSNKLNVLFTCIGRRVSLLESFRRAAGRLKINAAFFGTDTTELSAALQLCDRRFIVKPTKHPRYISELLSIVRANKVRLLVPTVDLDLKALAQNKARFSDLGCRVLASDPKVIDICQDKRRTYRFLVENSFDTPATVTVQTALRRNSQSSIVNSKSQTRFPLFVKPWDGSAGKGNAIVANRQELLFYSRRIPNAICQQFVEGVEFTCDVYVDFDMKVRCVVPRKRIEVRAGEVSKAQVAMDERMISQATRLVEKLGAGPGVITLQLFATGDGNIKFIEINPRFGGGAPLSIKAGADFPKWILQELTGEKPAIRPSSFKNNLTMLRYDSEVWLEE